MNKFTKSISPVAVALFVGGCGPEPSSTETAQTSAGAITYGFRHTSEPVLDWEGQGFFGGALDQTSNIAVVGAPGDRGGAGFVHVYERFGDEWDYIQRIDGWRRDGGFGRALHLDEDAQTLFVGTGGLRSAVYVFERDELGRFGRVQRIPMSDGRGRPGGILDIERFGTSILIGLPTDGMWTRSLPTASGSVRVLEKSGAYGRYDLLARIDSPPGVHRFGQVIDGPWVGAEDHVYEISPSASGWAIKRTFSGNPGECFGAALARIEHGAGAGGVFVGAPCADEGRGKAEYIFRSPPGFRKTFVGRSAGDRFGAYIERIQGQTELMLIGAPGRTVDGRKSAGEVYLYYFQTVYAPKFYFSAGSFTGKYLQANDFFGYRMAGARLGPTETIENEDPRDRTRRRRTPLTVSVSGRNRLEVVDIEQLFVSAR